MILSSSCRTASRWSEIFARDATDRFEAAPDPDGTLIPIPKEAPAGTPIRDDAKITVSAKQANGYYVAIYNGPPDSSQDLTDFLGELLTEASLATIETLFAGTAAGVSTMTCAESGGMRICQARVMRELRSNAATP